MHRGRFGVVYLRLINYSSPMKVLQFFLICLLASGTVACRKKSETAAKQIREAGYAMTAEGWFEAIRKDDVPVMKKMVSGGFDEKTADTEGNSGLHVAAEVANVKAAEYLLNRGFSVDVENSEGRTPLMSATLADRPEMVRWLLRQGANPKLKDRDGFMALMLAVTNNRSEVVEELATYHGEDLDSAVLLASLVGHPKVIDTLTNYGASVYARMEDGRTPLMLAAENGHHEAVAILMDIGASRFATTESGDTAQSFAVSNGHGEIAEMIEKGFGGQELALESEEEIADAMDEYLEEFLPEETQASGAETALAANEQTPENAAGGALLGAAVGTIAGDSVTGEDGNQSDPDTGAISSNTTENGGATASAVTSVKNLEGARVSAPATIRNEETTETAGTETDELPLVMRRYQQRELPVEFKKVSGTAASLRLAGAGPMEIQVEEGDPIPNSRLMVVKVTTRMETGKLNDSQPVEVGVVVVEDQDSGQRREWITGRPASSHDPVALVEDAITGQRYVAKQGQKFSSEDGREFVVSDVRPNQLVIEDTTTGEVRTLRLRGPKG